MIINKIKHTNGLKYNTQINNQLASTTYLKLLIYCQVHNNEYKS